MVYLKKRRKPTLFARIGTGMERDREAVRYGVRNTTCVTLPREYEQPWEITLESMLAV